MCIRMRQIEIVCTAQAHRKIHINYCECNNNNNKNLVAKRRRHERAWPCFMFANILTKYTFCCRPFSKRKRNEKKMRCAVKCIGYTKTKWYKVGKSGPCGDKTTMCKKRAFNKKSCTLFVWYGTCYVNCEYLQSMKYVAVGFERRKPILYRCTYVDSKV